ncbi:MAG: DUF72 domain-containing protein [Spirochaetes bacterium]|nr:DUF72 domain-containing protein [Spirochaetota bacterium]
MNKVKFYIGTSGWFYSHWINVFYPPDLSENQWLSFYAKYFNTVELNMSFYRTPFPNMIKVWLKKTDDAFIFSVKASRIITHVKKLNDVSNSIDKQNMLLEKFSSRAKAVLYQMPPSIHFNETNFKKLNNFIKLLNKNYDNVIEFRHALWWCDEVKKILMDNQISFCSVNGLNMPDELVSTSDSIYVRFHGKYYDSLYSDKELIGFKEKIIKTLELKKNIKRVYIYFNNDAGGNAVKNALFMKQIIVET